MDSIDIKKLNQLCAQKKIAGQKIIYRALQTYQRDANAAELCQEYRDLVRKIDILICNEKE